MAAVEALSARDAARKIACLHNRDKQSKLCDFVSQSRSSKSVIQLHHFIDIKILVWQLLAGALTLFQSLSVNSRTQ
jgi:hypothetical protein